MIVDRRGFLQTAGAAAGMAGLPAWALGKPRRTAYVASGVDWVDVFTCDGGAWVAAERIASCAASAVCVGHGRLYVGCGVEDVEGRPGGAVEEFLIGGRRAQRVRRQGLALFAARPMQMSLSPHGRWLAVGLADGGYNLLELGRDGGLGAVTAALRRVGVQRKIDGLRFDDEGTLVSFDGPQATRLKVSEDGALTWLPDAAGTALEPRCDEGLVRAMARVGLREGTSVAYA